MRSKSLTLSALALFAAFGLFVLPGSRASEKTGAAKQVTFNKEVAPIFFKHCAECHRPGESAPMSLLTYKEARPWAKSIREKVTSREMPPWHADPHVGQFANDRRLSQAEVEAVAAWVEGGAKEGEAKDLPPAPQFAAGWSIGRPDLVLQMPEEFALEAGGPDEYQYFEVPTNFTEDRYVQMAEARPGNRKVVHHIIAFVQPPKREGDRPKLSKEEIQKQREKADRESIRYREGFLVRTKADAPVHDDGCQLPGGGGGNRRDGGGRDEESTLLAGYAPGMNQAVWEPGTVKKIPAGSSIVFQVHYSKVAGAAEKDRSSVGLIFAKTPPEKMLHTKGVANGFFLIPPGAERHKATACWTVKDDIHVVTLMPHMHLRGVAMEYQAHYPDGRSEVLLNVPSYSFSWQTVYYLEKPKPLPKGTRVMVTGVFDNSAKNKHNPDPTKAVRFGEPTYDEMMIGWVDYTVDNQRLKPAAALNVGGGAQK